MIVGVVKELKPEELRIAATPMALGSFVQAGHRVLVESTAGVGSGFNDQDYAQFGCEILGNAEKIWGNAEMIYHVKEPMPCEYAYLREGQILLSYLHLAAQREVAFALMKKGISSIALETVELDNGSTPLLYPMSAIAGKTSIIIAAYYTSAVKGGCGRLLCGIAGIEASNVTILGGGVVGTNAASVALGMGAHVIVIDQDLARLRYLEEILHGHLTTMAPTKQNIAASVVKSDIVIGAVLSKGARAPILVTKDMVSTMRHGSVIVDVAVDQGGCIETTHPTTHQDPIYTIDGVIHYCVPNIPGQFPETSTIAFSNATLPYALEIANLGLEEALRIDRALRRGLNVYRGEICHEAVAKSLGIECKYPERINLKC